VVAVATAALPGRPIAVTASDDDMVRVWDLATGTPIAEPLTGPTHRVVAVATAVLPDGRPVAVTGSDDATVRVWDLATYAPLGRPLTGHTGRVRAVACAVLPDGRPVAVTGSDDATVRVWDLATGTPLGRPLTGHTGRVRAVAVACAVLPDGRPVAVTGSEDATVRVWDLTRACRRRPGWLGRDAPFGVPLTIHIGPVWAMATAVLPDGRPVVVIGSSDGAVRVWDLTSGPPLGEPLTGHRPGGGGGHRGAARRPPGRGHRWQRRRDGAGVGPRPHGRGGASAACRRTGS
jgi:WD40 repeat protein